MLKWIRPIYATRRRKWMLAVAIVFLAFTITSIEVTSRSWFCNSCHIMKPYYQSWTRDPHRDIECVQCHIPPGGGNKIHAKLDGLAQVLNDVLHRSATKPTARVSDFACTRSGCHVTADLGKPDNGELPYHFDHSVHLEMEYLGIKIHCATCHSFIKEGDAHFEVNTSACISCHLMDSYEMELAGAPRRVSRGVSGAAYGAPAEAEPRDPTSARVFGTRNATVLTSPAPASCDVCHDTPDEPFEYRGVLVDHEKYLSYDADCRSCHKGVTTPPPPVDDSRCLNCHAFGMEKAPALEELHRLHVEGRHKVECFHCHGLFEHGAVAEAMMLDEFDCRSCHAGQHNVQRSMYLHAPEQDGVRLERLAVSPMFLTHVPCTGCHTQMDDVRVRPGSGARVARAGPESCDNCHKPGLGRLQVPQWQRDTRRLYDEVSEVVEAARAHAEGGDDPHASQLVHDAEQLLEIVRLDGSWGVHNPRYTQSLLERARVYATRVIAPRDEPGNGDGIQ